GVQTWPRFFGCNLGAVPRISIAHRSLAPVSQRPNLARPARLRSLRPACLLAPFSIRGEEALRTRLASVEPRSIRLALFAVFASTPGAWVHPFERCRSHTPGAYNKHRDRAPP